MQTAGNLKPISKRPADGYQSTQNRHASFVPHIPSIRSEWEDKPKISQRMIHSSTICTAEVWKLAMTEHMTWKQRVHPRLKRQNISFMLTQYDWI